MGARVFGLPLPDGCAIIIDLLKYFQQRKNGPEAPLGDGGGGEAQGRFEPRDLDPRQIADIVFMLAHGLRDDLPYPLARNLLLPPDRIIAKPIPNARHDANPASLA